MTRLSPLLGAVGERALIQQILPGLARLKPRAYQVPPGDDAAVLRRPKGLVLSIDALTDGTHFRSKWEKPLKARYGLSLGRVLGWKLLGASLSDLAAMGDVRERWSLIFLAAPAEARVP